MVRKKSSFYEIIYFVIGCEHEGQRMNMLEIITKKFLNFKLICLVFFSDCFVINIVLQLVLKLLNISGTSGNAEKY